MGVAEDMGIAELFVGDGGPCIALCLCGSWGELWGKGVVQIMERWLRLESRELNSGMKALFGFGSQDYSVNL